MKSKIQKVFCSLMLVFVSAYAYGADPAKPSDPKLNIEHHEKMAAHHQKAADCLKAGRPADTCKKEMMKDCPMMKAGECQHMDGGMGNMSNEEHMKMMKNKSQKK